MCMCGKPTINGQPNAYSWDGKTFTTRQPTPPSLVAGDVLLWDEPGRCGGIDAHSHHFRLVQFEYGVSRGYAILVRHGGGEERLDFGDPTTDLFLRSLPSTGSLDSNSRYWLMHAIYSTVSDVRRRAEAVRDAVWRGAAAEKRIKVRKVRGRNAVRVEIEPARHPAAREG